MNNLLGLLSLLLVEWPLSGSGTPSFQRPYDRQIDRSHLKGKDHFAPNSYNQLIERRSRTNPWIKANVPSRKQYEEYYHSHINPKTVDLERKTFKFTRRVPGKSYGMKKQRWEDGPSKWTDSKRVRPAMRDVQKSLRPKDTVKKATLSSKPRLPRNQGDQKKKKQYIVANWGGLPLGNGLALGLAGTPTASY